VIARSLLRRALVGLAVFLTMVAMGVVFAAGGDQNPSKPRTAPLTAVSAMSAERSRHAADAAHPQPNPRAPRPRSPGSRSNPL